MRSICIKVVTARGYGDPHPVVRTITDLKALKVGVINGAKPAETAVEAGVPLAALVGFNRREELLDALKKGDVGAGILRSVRR